MASSNVSGMAASIRNAVESETFDLAGQNVTTITNVIQDAFREPFQLPSDNNNNNKNTVKMIRITLVTGAGKLARQKYDENAAKAVTTALRELGYQEDRAASCVVECAGTFKLQHDTGKNLKTVVVFPKLSISSNNNHDSNRQDDASNAFSSMNINDKDTTTIALTLIPGLTTEQWKALTISSSKAVFEKMINSKCPSWIQKRQCLQYLDQIKTVMEEMDQRLCKGQVLTDTEQAFYDYVSLPVIEEKQAIVKDQMHHLVEQGQITLEEKRVLLSQVSERIEHLTKDIESTAPAQKIRRDKLSSLHQKAVERKSFLEKITSLQTPHALRHEMDIRKLRKELQPLVELEASTKGRLLSIKETQTLARKDEILHEIEQLENASRGWFEEDSLFTARLQASRSAWAALVKQAKKKQTTSSSTATAGRTASNTNPWNTSKPRAPAKTTAPATSKSKSGPNRGGSVFAAMMMDSDSE